MFIVKRKHFIILFNVFLLLFITHCQLQEPKKTHGINFLENREKLLIVNKTNKNDIINIIGNPHSRSFITSEKWIYFERTITRGKLHKLGRNVLKKNNILELEFNKYGVLKNKKIYDKTKMKKVAYSKKKTENTVTQQSFVGKFLSSVKQKMYGKRKF